MKAMKASEAIKKLQKLVEQFGDHDLHNNASWGEYVASIEFDPDYSGGLGRFIVIDRDGLSEE